MWFRGIEMGKNRGFFATDLAKRQVDKVRLRAKYSIEIRRKDILLSSLSLANFSPFHIAVRGAIVAKEISLRHAFGAI